MFMTTYHTTWTSDHNESQVNYFTKIAKLLMYLHLHSMMLYLSYMVLISDTTSLGQKILQPERL